MPASLRRLVRVINPLSLVPRPLCRRSGASCVVVVLYSSGQLCRLRTVKTTGQRAADALAGKSWPSSVRRLVFDQMDSGQARAFGQAFEAILTALEEDSQ
jgi:hypothetical protein